MNAQWLIEGDPWLRLAVLALIGLPAVFILFSRHSRGWRKLLWMTSTQLPWLFVVLYVWVWVQRYAEAPADSPTLEGAFGWWLLAFPWAVYLLYRATRHRRSATGKSDSP